MQKKLKLEDYKRIFNIVERDRNEVVAVIMRLYWAEDAEIYKKPVNVLLVAKKKLSEFMLIMNDQLVKDYPEELADKKF